MAIFKHLIIALLDIVALTVLVHAQSQSDLGFISIDCGWLQTSGYTDEKTGIDYISDANFTDNGDSSKAFNISSEYDRDTLEQPFRTVRSFPTGRKNCYTVKLTRPNVKFLIRASFMYGNYDGKSQPPRFDLLLEADVWDTVEFTNESDPVIKEILHLPQRNYVHVCLINTYSGTPFISSLELRPLNNLTYLTQSGSLLLHSRLDVGSNSDKPIRYKDDIYDRIWTPYNRPDWKQITTSLPVNRNSEYQQPSAVMRTAVIPADGSNCLTYSTVSACTDNEAEYHVYMHFAELQLQEQANNQPRQLYIYANGRLWNNTPYDVPSYLYSGLAYTSANLSNLDFSINKTQNSPLPPILNAIEIYREQELSQALTDQQDVEAIKSIKTEYGLIRSSWQGDPCSPKVHSWQGIKCSSDDNTPLRITSLDLSSSGISGPILPSITRLIRLESLDLSNNSLTGPVPSFLSQLAYLKMLNLDFNDLEGPVPAELTARKKAGRLMLRVEGNPDITTGKKKRKNVLPIVAKVIPACVAVLFLIAALSIMWILKTRSQGNTWNKNKRSLEPNRRFSYSDVMRITDNFKRIIGKGGFGTVYHGNLNDTQVAVKMLSASSVQGDKEFQTEVELLLRVHHRNLTTLVGYCDDVTNKGLIYEFMVNGNLESHLLDEGSSTATILSWEGRLRIATEAAQGLDYLHSGCKPPIVHRDVKPANILLNEKFQAKISDFGLSRIFSIESDTHVSTTVAGTPGYLDPEYYTSNRLTEKSDMYSFGVVLLQMITSKPAIEKSNDRTHIIQWVSFMLAKGDIENVVDPRLQGDFNMDSVSKAVKLAMACVSQNSADRPTMNQVVINLNECLAIEMARTKVRHETESKSSTESSELPISR